MSGARNRSAKLFPGLQRRDLLPPRLIPAAGIVQHPKSRNMANKVLRDTTKVIAVSENRDRSSLLMIFAISLITLLAVIILYRRNRFAAPAVDAPVWTRSDPNAETAETASDQMSTARSNRPDTIRPGNTARLRDRLKRASPGSASE